MTRAGIVAGVASLAAVAGTWLTWHDTTTTATTGMAPATAGLDGAQLFASKGCATCHDGPASSARIEIAPSLRHASSWAASRRAGYSAEDYLAESMLAPGAFISPARPSGSDAQMPTLGLTIEEVDALVAYLLDT